MRSLARALYVCPAVAVGLGTACTPLPILAPLDPPPESLLVVVNRSSLGGVFAFDRPEVELTFEGLPRDGGARLDLLAYDRPLAALGLPSQDGLLDLALDETPGVPLPLPNQWLTGATTDFEFAPPGVYASEFDSPGLYPRHFAGEPPDADEFERAMSEIRVRPPRCPTISVIATVDLDTRARAEAVAALSDHAMYVGTRGQVFDGVLSEPPRHYVVSTDRAVPIAELSQSSTSTSAGAAELAVELDGHVWAWTYARGAQRPALHQLDRDGNIVATRPLAAPEDEVPAVLSAQGGQWVWGGFANTVGLIDLEAGRFTVEHQEQGETCPTGIGTRILQLDDPTHGVVSFTGGSLRTFTIEGGRILLGERVLGTNGPTCRAARARDARSGREVVALDSPATPILGDLPAGDVWWRDRPDAPWQRWTSHAFYARAVALAGPHIVLVDRFGSASVLDVSTRPDLPPRWCPGPQLGLSVYSLTRVGEYVVAAGIPLLDAPNRVAWLRVE